MSTHTNKTIQQICDEDTGDSSLITNLVRRGKELEEKLDYAVGVVERTSELLKTANSKNVDLEVEVINLREDNAIFYWWQNANAPDIMSMSPIDDDTDRRTIYWVYGYKRTGEHRTIREALAAASREA